MNRNSRIILIIGLLFLFSITAACGDSGEKTPAPAGETPNLNSEQENTDISVDELFARGKAIEGMSFEYEVTVPDNPVISAKMWVEGENVRNEMPGPDGSGDIITIIDSEKGLAYMYQPAQNMATKMDFSSLQQEESYSPQNSMEELNSDDLLYVDKETIDGKICLLYEYKDLNNVVGKVWIWEEYGIPLKMEYTENGQKATVVYRNVEIGDVPDSTFELPEGVQVMDLNIPNFDGKMPDING